MSDDNIVEDEKPVSKSFKVSKNNPVFYDDTSKN